MRFLFIITLLGLVSPSLMASSGVLSDEDSLTNVAGILEGCYRPCFVPTSLVPVLAAFVAPANTMQEYQFEDPLKWYQPTPDELTFLSSLNFQPEHLGAALRFRKFITPENAGLFQKVLGDSTWKESQNLMAAALGLSAEVLEEAALISAYQDRCDFLIDTPREDAWVYGMLGSDPYIDTLLQGHIKKRIEASPEYVSALFIRNLKEGSDLTRMRLTGFLLQVVDALKNQQRFQKLGYQTDSNVVRVLEKRKSMPPFGCFFAKYDMSGYPLVKLIHPNKGAPMPAWTYTPSPFLEPIM